MNVSVLKGTLWFCIVTNLPLRFSSHWHTCCLCPPISNALPVELEQVSSNSILRSGSEQEKNLKYHFETQQFIFVLRRRRDSQTSKKNLIDQQEIANSFHVSAFVNYTQTKVEQVCTTVIYICEKWLTCESKLYHVQNHLVNFNLV